MSFMPQAPKRLVPGFGKDSAKIVVVGDFTSPFDNRELRPFSGPPGSTLESCLHSASLISSDVYLTNTIKSVTTRPYKAANTEFFIDDGAKKRQFTALGLEHAAMLQAELNKRDFNVIVACGNASLMALTDFDSVAKYRGYVCASTKLDKVRKIIPTYSPSSTIRGTYINRH